MEGQSKSSKKISPYTNRGKTQTDSDKIQTKFRWSKNKEIDTSGWNLEDWNQFIEEEHIREEEEHERTLFNPDSVYKLSEDQILTAMFADYSEKNLEHKFKLEKVLSQLSPREQQIVKMKYWYNMKNSQIARTLSLKHQTIDRFLDRAMKKLKNIITKMKRQKISNAIVDAYLKNASNLGDKSV